MAANMREGSVGVESVYRRSEKLEAMLEFYNFIINRAGRCILVSPTKEGAYFGT